LFTGIIEEVGAVESIERRQTGARLRIRCRFAGDCRAGESIAVNGVCLTAVEPRLDSFAADLAPETLHRSNLGDLAAGHGVNLERALPAGGRLSGHIVQGHVDTTAEFLSLEPLGAGNWWLRVRIPEGGDRYLVHKGSIAIDGISLTIASLEAGVLAATIVPHTAKNTNLESRRPGDRLNLEFDIVAKYVEKLLGPLEPPGGLTLNKLKEMGY
jgi:riboflavin synthase